MQIVLKGCGEGLEVDQERDDLIGIGGAVVDSIVGIGRAEPNSLRGDFVAEDISGESDRLLGIEGALSLIHDHFGFARNAICDSDAAVFFRNSENLNEGDGDGLVGDGFGFCFGFADGDIGDVVQAGQIERFQALNFEAEGGREIEKAFAIVGSALTAFSTRQTLPADHGQDGGGEHGSEGAEEEAH